MLITQNIRLLCKNKLNSLVRETGIELRDKKLSRLPQLRVRLGALKHRRRRLCARPWAIKQVKGFVHVESVYKVDIAVGVEIDARLEESQ